MSLYFTLYGPRHYFWKQTPDAWFYQPDEYSSGGTGLKFRFWPLPLALYICFMWGHS